MNFLDKIIGYISPMSAVKRAFARDTLARINSNVPNKRSYEAAGRGRRFEDWQTFWNPSPTNQAITSLQKLVERSRDLFNNNAWIYTATDVLTNKSIVEKGIVPAFTVYDNKNSTKQSNEKNKILQEYWRQWADSTNCDFYGRTSLAGLQALILRTVLVSGECLVLRHYSEKGLELRILEPDHIDTNMSDAITNGGDFNFAGIRFNKDGKPLGVWVKSDLNPMYQNETGKSKLILNTDIHHVFLSERPSQARGIPYGVSAFVKVKNLAQFEDAQLMRQLVAACFSVFITAPIPSNNIPSFSPNLTDNSERYENERIEKIEPAIVQYLNEGESVTFAAPPPAENYGPYTKAILHSIAAAFGIAFESLTNDFTDSNFSSARLARQNEKHTITKMHRMLTPLMDKIFIWFKEWMLLRTDVSNGLLSGRVICEWTLPVQPMVDPVRETNAQIAEVKAMFKSPQEVIREKGGNPDDIVEEIKTWNEMLLEKGIPNPNQPQPAEDKDTESEN